VHLGDVGKVVMTTATVLERRSEQKSGDPIDKFRKRFNGTREMSTVVTINRRMEECVAIAYKVHMIGVNANFEALVFCEI